jgi:hypothetical protein
VPQAQCSHQKSQKLGRNAAPRRPLPFCGAHPPNIQRYLVAADNQTTPIATNKVITLNTTAIRACLSRPRHVTHDLSGVFRTSKEMRYQ